MENTKITKTQQQEVIADTMKNLQYLDLYEIIKNLTTNAPNARSNRKFLFDYLDKRYSGKLHDALIYNGIIKEEEE